MPPRSITILLLPMLAACTGAGFESEAGPQQNVGGQASASGGVIHSGAGGGGPGGASTGGQPRVFPPECGKTSPSEAPDSAETCVVSTHFTMGSNVANVVQAGLYNHAPAHPVTLSTYWIDLYEVTVARYRACADAGACSTPGSTDGGLCTYPDSPGSESDERRPVTCVTWEQAQAFCQWNGSRRLPTEAEWERAARGPGSRDYAWSGGFDCKKAVGATTGACTGQLQAHAYPVGSFPAGDSPEGLKDSVGNAAEWVADALGVYSAEAQTDPKGPRTTNPRVIRGGSWLSNAVALRVFERAAENSSKLGPTGFRCARSP